MWREAVHAAGQEQGPRYRGVLVFRWASLAWMVSLDVVTRDEFRRPWLVWAGLVVALAWTLVLTLCRPRNKGAVLWVDLGIAADVEVTGADLRAAVVAVLTGRRVPQDQRPSLGCNIKLQHQVEERQRARLRRVRLSSPSAGAPSTGSTPRGRRGCVTGS
jgi:hypothetical protein